MSSEPLEQRIWMDAPVAEAWQAWIDEERITQWFAPSARIEAWAGGAFDLYFETAAASRERRRGCRIRCGH